MKKQDRPVYSLNFIKARKAQDNGKGWSQEKAADLLGWSRKTYSSYEEGRAKPAITVLPLIAHVFGITNIIGFLEDPTFCMPDQDKEFMIIYESPLEKRYAEAPERDRKIVDVTLGIGTD